MTSFEVYKKYIAITTHFKGSYDYHKYNGQINLHQSSFLKRKDRYFFEKIARNYGDLDVSGFILSNTVKNRGKYWLASFENAARVYLEWRRITEALPHYFSNECDNIIAELNERQIGLDGLFSSETGLPLIIRLLMNDVISIETVIIIDYILSFVDRCHRKCKDDPIWCEYHTVIKKYQPFLIVSDLSKYKAILKERVENLEITPHAR